jgi:dihydrofolate reductase
MLWHLPEDFARFKRVTMGGVMIMGRRTYESLGAALRGRTSIVMTRNREWVPTNTAGVEVFAVPDLAHVVQILAERPHQRWWSCGGGEIYRALWDYTTHLDITEVKAAPEGTVCFPFIDPDLWREISREPHADFDFVTYARVQSDASDVLRALVDDAP